METSNFLRKKAFAVIGAGLVLGMLMSGNAWCQKTSDKYLDKLPSGLKLKEDKPQRYLLTERMTTSDANGIPVHNILITAEYTRAVAAGRVGWNNVRISMAPGDQEPAAKGNLVECMQGFSYPMGAKNVLKQDFFTSCPASENISFLRTLPGSTLRFEVFAWSKFDSLLLNQPKEMKSNTVELENYATVKFKRLNLTWIGVSKMNDKMCAVIAFRTGVNPLEISDKTMKGTGSIIFEGKVWVSLTDKQIEYGNLHEFSVMNGTFASNTEKQIVTVLNDVTLERIK